MAEKLKTIILHLIVIRQKYGLNSITTIRNRGDAYPTVMTLDEINRILKSLYSELRDNSKPDKYTYKAQTRNIAIVELLFATGVRVSELCSLTCNNIDLKRGVMKIVGKGNKERVIQI